MLTAILAARKALQDDPGTPGEAPEIKEMCFYLSSKEDCQGGIQFDDAISQITSITAPTKLIFKDTTKEMPFNCSFSDLPNAVQLIFQEGNFQINGEEGNIALSAPFTISSQTQIETSGPVAIEGKLPAVSITSSAQETLVISLNSETSQIGGITAASIVEIKTLLSMKIAFTVDTLDLKDFFKIMKSNIKVIANSIISSFPDDGTVTKATPNLNFPIQFAMNEEGISSLSLSKKMKCPFCKNNDKDDDKQDHKDDKKDDKEKDSKEGASKVMQEQPGNQDHPGKPPGKPEYPGKPEHPRPVRPGRPGRPGKPSFDPKKSVALTLINQISTLSPKQNELLQASSIDNLLKNKWVIMTTGDDAIKFSHGGRLTLILSGDESSSQIGFKPTDHIFGLKDKEMEYDDEIIEWTVFAKEKPHDKTYKVCYGLADACKNLRGINIETFDKMPNFTEIASSGLKRFVLFVRKSFGEKEILDLSWLNDEYSFQIKGDSTKPEIHIKLEEAKQDQPEEQDTPPNSDTPQVLDDQSEPTIPARKVILLEQLTFNDKVEFNNANVTLKEVDGASFIVKQNCALATSAEMYTSLKSPTVENLTIIGLKKVSKIIFGASKWSFIDASTPLEIEHDKVKKQMGFEISKEDKEELILTPDEKSPDTIRGMTIILEEDGKIRTVKEWKGKTIQPDICVFHGDKKVNIVSDYSDIPIKKIGKGQVGTKKIVQFDKGKKPIWKKEDFHLKDNEMQFELDTEEEEVDVDDVKFEGESSIKMTNKEQKELKINIKRAIVSEGGYAQYKKLLIKNLLSMSPGSEMYGEDESSQVDIENLEMKWVRNKVPTIDVGNSSTTPKEFKIRFDSEMEGNLSSWNYNSLWDGKAKNGRLLISGSGKFECTKWKEVARFESNISAFSSAGKVKFTLECKPIEPIQPEDDTPESVKLLEDPNEGLYMKLASSLDEDSLVAVETTPKESTQSNTSSNTPLIIGCVVGCVVVVAIVGFIIYRVKKSHESQDFVSA